MRKKTSRRGLLYGAGGIAAAASVLLLVTTVTPRPAAMDMGLGTAAAVTPAGPAVFTRVTDTRSSYRPAAAPGQPALQFASPAAQLASLTAASDCLSLIHI